MDEQLIAEAKRLGVSLKCEREHTLIRCGRAKSLVDQINRFLQEYNLDDAYIKLDYDRELTINATIPRTEQEVRKDIARCREAAARKEAAERRLYEELKRKFEGETK